MPLLPVLAFLLLFAPRPELVRDVREAIDDKNFAKAEQVLAAYKTANGADSVYLEALSWMARGQLAAKAYDEADKYAVETRRLVLTQLYRRELDADSSLPIALGASIEVHAQVLNAQGQKSEAVAFLREEVDRWRKTSIRARVQKNLNLINLEGRSALPLEIQEYLGPAPKPLTRYRGSVVLLFFWAHWCGDCKAEAPVLARNYKEMASQGLVIIGPTQRYGYAAKGDDATPAEELKYIDEVRRKFYADLPDMPVPVSEENFRVWGSSTTPTLVLIDRGGIVRLYHPGALTYEELLPRIQALLGRK
jgi:thiol-disulfide isomerase/thioredoxin